MKKKKDRVFEEPEEEVAEKAQAVRKPKERGKGARILGKILNGLFGFGLATGIVVVIAALCVEYIAVKGPSESLKDKVIMTMIETRRTDFIANIFLTEDEVAEYVRNKDAHTVETDMDASLISIASAEEENTQIVNESGEDAYGLCDDDGDGIIFQQVKGSGYLGYMIVILDPTRVFVGMPDYYGGSGLTLEQMVEKYDAIGGINAGGFKDDGGSGSGGNPEGLTIIDGVYYNEDSLGTPFAGVDAKGLLHVGYYTAEWAKAEDIRYGVSFGPLLIMNGEACDFSHLVSGVNPRTAIAQRADGAIIMLVIDGRQVQSLGATYQDVVELLLSYGAVNACNMDGGSSTCMYYNGEYVNSSSSAAGERLLPNAFLIRK